MGDRYSSFARSSLGKPLVKRLGLPDPPKLVRWQPGQAIGPVLLGPDNGPHFAALTELLRPVESPERYHALVFDATGLSKPEDLQALYEFFHPVARSLTANGRVIVIGKDEQTAAQRALDGFVRSVGKEFGRGTTAQLIRLRPGATIAGARSTIDFLLSTKSAYVSGQTIVVGAGTPGEGDLTGKVALVTGAARGIGAEIADVLSRDGAHVICLDVPAAGQELARVANRVKGEALQLDLTGDADLAQQIKARHAQLDIVVHNAGITRDKTLAKMDQHRWESVLGVNLIAPARVTEALLAAGLIPQGGGGRIIGVASIAGIAGNRGQTNYATSKAGVIGWIHEVADQVRDLGITANAVAPGFIETAMTAKMPLMVREAGRRMNSMSQGGLPVDVAETIAWLAAPASSTVTGNVVRVCGQMILGA
jgi:3-oxoacyl-[acyl-carrier protein] reductase